MKTWHKQAIAASAIVAGLGLGVSAAATAAPIQIPTPSPTTTTATATASADVAKDLAYMREEERLARDTYLAIAKLYPDNALQFERIANSEQRHYDSVGYLLTRYGLSDPSAGKAAGSYAYPALTELYNKLLAQAKTSLTEAYKVGVAIEQVDIDDLNKALATDLPADVKAVFGNLKAGSDNHLASFTALRDGKTIGIGAGMGGPQNGRGGYGRQATADPSSTVTPGYGAGQGYGRNGGQARPADCPLS